MDSLLICLLMEHSVVTKGSPSVKPGTGEILALFDALQPLFHENYEIGIHFRQHLAKQPSNSAFHRVESTSRRTFSSRKSGFRMFQGEEFRRNF
jgi:hypothetical protein